MYTRRYEVNPELVDQIEDAGMLFVGKDETGERMEIVELAENPNDHPFYVGAQFHPEFKSRPLKPSPLFLGFILASGKRLDGYLRSRSRSTPTTPKKAPMADTAQLREQLRDAAGLNGC